MTDILAVGWKNNADMVADGIAPFGWLDGKVIDLTYNTGKFWRKWRPANLVTNDTDRTFETDWHEDCRDTSWNDQIFDAAVVDLPYKLTGTPASGRMDVDYGTTFYRSLDTVSMMHVEACSEAARIARIVHVKTMNQVCGGKVRWLCDDVTTHMGMIGMRKVTQLMVVGYRPQPKTNRDGTQRTQEHPVNNYSTWMVFDHG